MVPFSSLQGQIGAATDEHLLEARGYIDAIKKRTLAFRDDLPVKHDWLTGEAMEGPDSLYLLPHIERKRLNPADKNVALVQSEILTMPLLDLIEKSVALNSRAYNIIAGTS